MIDITLVSGVQHNDLIFVGSFLKFVFACFKQISFLYEMQGYSDFLFHLVSVWMSFIFQRNLLIS